MEGDKKVGRQGQYCRYKPNILFAQRVVQQYQEEGDNLGPGMGGATSNIIYYNCNAYGNMSYNCPAPDHRKGHLGYGFVKIGVSLAK